MPLFFLFELTFAVTVGWICITQILIPLYMGRKVFPMFRESEGVKELEKEFSHLKEEQYKNKLQHDIDKLKNDLKNNSETST